MPGEGTTQVNEVPGSADTAAITGKRARRRPRPRGVSARRQAAAAILALYLFFHAAFIAALATGPFYYALDPAVFPGHLYLRLVAFNLSIGTALTIFVSPLIAVVTVRVLWAKELRKLVILILALAILGSLATAIFFIEFALMGWGRDLWQQGGVAELASDALFERAVAIFAGGNLLVFLSAILLVLGAETAPIKRIFGKFGQ